MNAKKRYFWITLFTLAIAIILLCLLRDYRKTQKYKLPKQRSEAHAMCQNIAISIASFVADASGNPAQETAVERLMSGDIKWCKSSYADTSLKYDDPWGNEYIIEIGDEVVTVSSKGADRMMKTPDDIIVKKSTERK